MVPNTFFQRWIHFQMANSLDHPRILERKTYADGRVILREGEEGSCAYVIQSGAVDIVRDSGDSKLVLAHLEAGSIFGEMALIDQAPRMASAITAQPTTLVMVKEADLRAKLEASDPFVARLLNMLVSNIRSTTDTHVAGQTLTTWEGRRKMKLDIETS